MISTPIYSVEPEEWLNKSLVLSSQQMGWNGILVQQFQSVPTSTVVEIPALSNPLAQLTARTTRSVNSEVLDVPLA